MPPHETVSIEERSSEAPFHRRGALIRVLFPESTFSSQEGGGHVFERNQTLVGLELTTFRPETLGPPTTCRKQEVEAERAEGNSGRDFVMPVQGFPRKGLWAGKRMECASLDFCLEEEAGSPRLVPSGIEVPDNSLNAPPHPGRVVWEALQAQASLSRSAGRGEVASIKDIRKLCSDKPS